MRPLLIALAVRVLSSGLIVFAAAATEREWLELGVAVCLMTLLGWELWRLRSRRQSSA